MATNAAECEEADDGSDDEFVEIDMDELPDDDEPSDLADVIAEESGRGSFPPGCCQIGVLKRNGLEEAGYLYEV